MQILEQSKYMSYNFRFHVTPLSKSTDFLDTAFSWLPCLSIPNTNCKDTEMALWQGEQCSYSPRETDPKQVTRAGEKKRRSQPKPHNTSTPGENDCLH